jgi:hypothetical protein
MLLKIRCRENSTLVVKFLALSGKLGYGRFEEGKGRPVVVHALE